MKKIKLNIVDYKKLDLFKKKFKEVNVIPKKIEQNNM